MAGTDVARPRWWRLALALAPTVAAGAVLVTSWSGLRGGHPAYPVLLVVVLVVGLVTIATALRHRRSRPPVRRSWPRLAGLALGRVVALLLVGALTAALVWLRPFSATGVDLAGGTEGAPVDVTTTFTRIDLAPVGRRAQAGLVFYPGARVDPRAYLPLLTRVAAQGYRVVVVKPPFDLAVLATGAVGGIVDGYPEVERWAVGGHSLGGVVAASAAGSADDARVAGLVLWASYPAADLSDADLDVTSIYGTRDGLTRTSDVEASRADLPSSTTFVPVEGLVHGFFGDYGEQPGDGTPAVSRADAQDVIVDATVAALGALDPVQQPG